MTVGPVWALCGTGLVGAGFVGAGLPANSSESIRGQARSHRDCYHQSRPYSYFGALRAASTSFSFNAISRIALSVSSQAMQASVTDTPYFSSDKSLGML
jgi:hypothetical protein